MGYAGGGVNGSLRWRDLALDRLLPVDEEKEEAERAAQARKMASGATQHPPHPPHPPQTPPQRMKPRNEAEPSPNSARRDSTRYTSSPLTV